jgi:hypothetical protein
MKGFNHTFVENPSSRATVSSLSGVVGVPAIMMLAALLLILDIRGFCDNRKTTNRPEA